MSRTRFLAAIAVAALLMQFFPKYDDFIKWLAIGLGVLYLLVRALRTYPRQFRQKQRLAAQRASDEREFRDYTDELDSLRVRYASEPGRYKAALADLHDKHRDMLERKFGSAKH